MEPGKHSSRALKRKVLDLLNRDDFDQTLNELCLLPGRRVVNPLVSFLCHHDQRIKWRAVTALGVTVANLAEKDMESARVIMRRFMWMLNDESGGIGWGAPEAMAEIMACHERLAEEYVHILISYMREDANFLEHEILQRGVVWGIGRLAQVRPHLLQSRGVAHDLPLYLESRDSMVRGLAIWALGLLGTEPARARLESFVSDDGEVELYLNRKLVTCSVGGLAKEALATLQQHEPLRPPSSL
ncbi:MAG: HEAT repeat domain-containing protein [Deltaproteobacteria bacterium]|nr:HEAT repeat domain-containing protein [Deltaproteobacteria bacterium]